MFRTAPGTRLHTMIVIAIRLLVDWIGIVTLTSKMVSSACVWTLIMFDKVAHSGGSHGCCSGDSLSESKIGSKELTVLQIRLFNNSDLNQSFSYLSEWYSLAYYTKYLTPMQCLQLDQSSINRISAFLFHIIFSILFQIYVFFYFLALGLWKKVEGVLITMFSPQVQRRKTSTKRLSLSIKLWSFISVFTLR